MIMRDRNYDGGLGLAQPANNSQKLSQAEAMRLLASVDYGRVVFTMNALPAIRPVNHLVDEDRIIIRTRLTTAISSVVRSADSGVVVAYEADDFDSQSQPAGASSLPAGRTVSTILARSRVMNDCCIRG